MDERRVQCPWCGERFEVLIDDSAGSQDYTEDCPVCCRPISMHLHADDPEGDAQLDIERE